MRRQTTEGWLLYWAQAREVRLRAFGELEERIMKILWRAAPATVREVHNELTRQSPLAYTTVMTVMDRLWRKGVLRRDPRGRAFEYSPVQSEAEYTAGLMHELLSRARDRKAALAHFARGMRKRDEAELLRIARDSGARKRR